MIQTKPAVQYLLGLLMLLPLTTALEAAPQHNCHNYAAIAVQDNEKNKAHSCGLSGPRWQSNSAAHHFWCSQPNTTMAMLSREHNARQAGLKKCLSKIGPTKANKKNSFRRPCSNPKIKSRIKTIGKFDWVKNSKGVCKYLAKKKDKKYLITWDPKAKFISDRKLLNKHKVKSAFRPWPDTKTCREYAGLAVDLYKLWEERVCHTAPGFKHKDFQKHNAWCMKASERTVSIVYKNTKRAIKECANKPPRRVLFSGRVTLPGYSSRTDYVSLWHTQYKARGGKVTATLFCKEKGFKAYASYGQASALHANYIGQKGKGCYGNCTVLANVVCVR